MRWPGCLESRAQLDSFFSSGAIVGLRNANHCWGFHPPQALTQVYTPYDGGDVAWVPEPEPGSLAMVGVALLALARFTKSAGPRQAALTDAAA